MDYDHHTMEKTSLQIHFEDRIGTEFERLCFAYILRIRDWISIDWYGQLGKDRGRDIEGQISISGNIINVCYQCANHQRLSFKKAKDDIDKIIHGPKGIPDEFVLILGGKISASMRDKVTEYALSQGIPKVDIWSGTELEERLRKETPDILRRFSEGESFPESKEALHLFVIQSSEFHDNDILELLAQCFDRPAFTTPFMNESSLPDFKKAISDTIEALNTGIHRLRDGTIIRQIPTRHHIRNQPTRDILSNIVDNLAKLRARFDSLSKGGEIRHCGCGDPDCPVYMVSERAVIEMDQIREEILLQYQSIYPEFNVHSPRFHRY